MEGNGKEVHARIKVRLTDRGERDRDFAGQGQRKNESENMGLATETRYV